METLRRGNGEQHLRHIVDGCHQLTNLPAILRSGQPQQHDSKVYREVDQRGKDRRRAQGSNVCLCQLPGGNVEFFRFLLLRIEGLYHTDGG